MSDLSQAEDAQRAMMELTSERRVRFQPLGEQLGGPCLRVAFSSVPLALRLGRRPDGRLICTGVLVGWTDAEEEVSSRDLHGLALQTILSEVARLARRAEAGQSLTIPAGAGHRYSEDDFAEIVRRYQEALLVAPGAPAKWLARSLGVSAGTAGRLLQRCRDRGLL